MKSQDVKVGETFSREEEERKLKRVLFEGKETVIYRCTVNVAALSDDDEVVFVPVGETITE